MKNKQNRWAIISLLGIAVLLVGGFWIVFPKSGSLQGHGKARLNWYTLQFFADQSGWAVTSQGVLHTQDAGQHWTVVSPPDFTDKTASAALTSAFLDGRNAWVVIPSGTQYVRYGNNQLPENAHAFHTAD